jgi:hypothetical protein
LLVPADPTQLDWHLKLVYVEVQINSLNAEVASHRLAAAQTSSRVNDLQLQLAASQAANGAMHASNRRLKQALAEAQQKYANHPAIALVDGEQQGRLAAEAALHDALKKLLPHQHAAIHRHEWQNRVLATVSAASAKAHAREAEAEQEKQRMLRNRADYLDARKRLRDYQSEAADLQIKVSICLPSHIVTAGSLLPSLL